MKIGCVKEIKKHEYRVGMTPDNVKEYRKHGHCIFVEAGLGLGSGFEDEEYIDSGATVLPRAEDVWNQSDMIIKVKEPLAQEYGYLRQDLIVFTYLHLAADEALTKAMLASKCRGVAYETLSDGKGGLPLLKPMSEIAGRLGAIEGAKYLEKPFGGKGVLISGVPGVRNAKVVVLGGGVVGTNAARMALGLGADVTIMDVNLDRLTALDNLFMGQVKTIHSTKTTVENELKDADVVIGAVLIPGASAPKLIKKEMLKNMKKGTVLVDVAVDQGGCSETTHPTYHDNPTYVVDGILHYCVANMPGAVPYTSTVALTNATIQYGLKIADMGLEKAIKSDAAIQSAINVYDGYCTFEGVAQAFSLSCTSIHSLVK